MDEDKPTQMKDFLRWFSACMAVTTAFLGMLLPSMPVAVAGITFAVLYNATAKEQRSGK